LLFYTVVTYIVLELYDPNASYAACVNIIVFIIDESTLVLVTLLAANLPVVIFESRILSVVTLLAVILDVFIVVKAIFY